MSVDAVAIEDALFCCQTSFLDHLTRIGGGGRCVRFLCEVVYIGLAPLVVPALFVTLPVFRLPT
jgi:hypothetical protein